MLLAENQVIERNIAHLPAGNVLLMDLLPDDALAEFSSQRADISWFGFTPFFDTYQKFANNSAVKSRVQFGHAYQGTNKFDAVVIYYPKTKLRFDYYLSNISKFLNADATIYVVGEKKGGVKSCEKQIKAYSPKANKLDAARHCQLYSAWFNGSVCDKTTDDWYSKKTLAMQVAGESITLDLFALPGVFSADRLDDGTQLLLETLEPVKGNGLDFGCGCGVISAAVYHRFKTQMTALDVDAFAVASSNKTFAENGIEANAIASNGLSELLSQKQKFDFIVTNPPFHTGIKTDLDITQTFMQQIRQVLTKKYTIWMVANSFLPYPELFKRHLKPCNTKNKNKRFNIYYCTTTL